MTTLVIGAGAIGRLVAGRLALGRQQVALVARSNVELLRANGIQISDRNGTLTTRPAILTAEQLPAERVELAIVAVKGYDTPSVLPLLAACRPHAILSLQNGVGNEELLAAQAAGSIIGGTITTPVEVLGPTQVRVAKERGIGVAAVQPAGAGVEAVVAMLHAVAADVRVYDDWRAMKWSKLLLNMLGNALPALLDRAPEQVYTDLRLVALERAAFLEALGVMRALRLRPVNLPRNPLRPLIAVMHLPPPVLRPLLLRLLVGGRGGKLPSLLLELRGNGPVNEGDVLYGAVARAATRVRSDAPLNQRLAELLAQAGEDSQLRDELRGRPEQLLSRLRR